MLQILNTEKQLLLGQPKAYPDDLLQGLNTFLNEQTMISRAYLAIGQYQEEQAEFFFLMGIEAKGNIEDCMKQYEAFVKNTSLKYYPITFVSAQSAPFKAYFSKIPFFYNAVE